MQVGLVTGAGKVELVEMATPEPQPEKAVVEISYCGICGTDVHAFVSGAPYNPAICGHEWVGHVSGVGIGVKHVHEGDRVAIGVASACGQCPTCQRGTTTHCEVAFAGAIGVGPLAAQHGGFASAIGFDASRLYHVPNALSDTEAGLLEPATVAVHAVRRTPMRLGDKVIVIGGGPIGLLVAQAAKINGAGTVILLEPEAVRRELGQVVGADLTLDPMEDGFTDAMDAHLGSPGADVVFECAGVPATIQQAVDLSRRGGTVSLVGVASGAASIDAAGWLVKEINLTSSIAYLHEDFEICKALVASKRMDVQPLHTSTVGLSELETAFNRLAQHPSEVKILVDPRL